MGCSPGDDQCNANERPTHQVTIMRGFWIGTTPVTNAALHRFEEGISRCKWPVRYENPDVPAAMVTGG